jgi:glycosyltransferase involved in cell wall biosynthesis
MINKFVSVVMSVGPRHDDFRELIEDYDAAISKCVAKYEYVIVIDGDYPDVFEDLAQFQNGGREVRVVQFTRNFGDSIAISVAIEKSQGELVLTLPSYYQIDPQSLPDLIGALEDNDMVEGRRWPRLDSKLNRFSTWLYHKILRLVTGHTYRDIGCSARLMRRQVAEEIILYGEQHKFLPILASSRGFRVRELSVPQSQRDPFHRYYGPGVYARRLLDIFTIFFLIRFTKAPLRFFGTVGSVFLAFGVLLVGLVVADRWFADMAAADRPMLLFGVVFLVLGVQLFALGLIGELIIFTHGRELKEYSVSEIVSLNDTDASADKPPTDQPIEQ